MIRKSTGPAQCSRPLMASCKGTMAMIAPLAAQAVAIAN